MTLAGSLPGNGSLAIRTNSPVSGWRSGLPTGLSPTSIAPAQSPHAVAACFRCRRIRLMKARAAGKGVRCRL